MQYHRMKKRRSEYDALLLIYIFISVFMKVESSYTKWTIVGEVLLGGFETVEKKLKNLWSVNNLKERALGRVSLNVLKANFMRSSIYVKFTGLLLQPIVYCSTLPFFSIQARKKVLMFISSVPQIFLTHYQIMI